MCSSYVVSGDIHMLMQKWAEVHGFTLPDKHFFAELRKKFTDYMTGIFPSFEFISEDELSTQIPALVKESNLPSISLDRVYFPQEMGIEITRVVTKDFRDLGLRRRAGSKSLLSQLRQMEQMGNASKEICLVDDVLFSGRSLVRLIHSLATIGMRVPVVCIGIAVNEGIKRVTEVGTEVRCIRKYDTIIDEVCERDFYPGVPFGGRQLASDAEVRIPYILPFGDLLNWASIPNEWQTDVSTVCLHQTIQLFKTIEECSGRKIFYSDLDYKIIGLPKWRMSYLDVLRTIYLSLSV